jgi:hypothetical protein
VKAFFAHARSLRELSAGTAGPHDGRRLAHARSLRELFAGTVITDPQDGLQSCWGRRGAGGQSMGGNEETTQKNALPSEYRELLFPLLRSDSAAAPLVCFEDKSVIDCFDDCFESLSTVFCR